MTDFNGIIEQLDAEWDTEGFFDHVRRGDYDDLRAQAILKLLRSINTEDDQYLPKRLVSQLWYLPSFLGWQVERVEKRGDVARYKRFITEVMNALEEVLGTP